MKNNNNIMSCVYKPVTDTAQKKICQMNVKETEYFVCMFHLYETKQLGSFLLKFAI